MSAESISAKSILTRIAELWQAEPSRIRWNEENPSGFQSFDYWPGDYRVKVIALPGKNGDSKGRIRIQIRTDYLKDVPISKPFFEQMSSDLSKFTTSCYAWIYPPTDYWDEIKASGEHPCLWLGSTAYIDESNVNWMTELLAVTGIMQPINAQFHAEPMPELFQGGKLHLSSPNGGKRAKPHQSLENLEQAYLEDGEHGSRFANTSEFEVFASRFGRSDNCFGFGDKTGLTLETPFGSDSALIKLETQQKHPQWGFGLLATLQLPLHDEKLVTARLAAELNLSEWIEWTHFPLMGCWHSAKSRSGQDSVAFTLFMPNTLFKPTLSTHVAVWLLSRARWVRQSKFPNLKDATMAEILEGRFGKL